MTTDDDRIRYLAKDNALAAALDLDERAELDAIANLLADSSTWDEPGADLANRVVAAITVERGQPPVDTPRLTAVPRGASPQAPRSRVLTFLAGAAAAAIIALALYIVPGRADGGVKIALAGTALAPGSSGSARVTENDSGLRIELNATGLPRRAGRLFYQAWLKGDGGLVPIGTFHTGDHVVLWAGVALRDFPTITVTQEEVGDQNSSGQKVLTGTLSG